MTTRECRRRGRESQLVPLLYGAQDLHIDSVPAVNGSNPGVTAAQLRAALLVLFNRANTKIPSNVKSQFAKAVVQTSIWVGSSRRSASA
jgi:hypothetical protein